MTSFKSHTAEQMINAVKVQGQKLFELETSGSGNDDVLIGDSIEDVLGDVLDFHEIAELPADWHIRETSIAEQGLDMERFSTIARR